MCVFQCLFSNVHAAAPEDYGAVTNQVIEFSAGQERAIHTITIAQDDICETEPDENFFSNIVLQSGEPPIMVVRPRAEVIIDDSGEPECSKQHYCSMHTLQKHAVIFSVHAHHSQCLYMYIHTQLNI